MKKLLVLFGLMFVIFACSNDCLNMVNECLNGNFSEKNNNENNQGNSNTEDSEKRPTTLQEVVDNANAGEEIDLSKHELTNYTATIDKKLTIKNGSLDNAKLSVKSEGVKLENLTGLSVSASSKLTITDSKLSDLLIGGSGEISRSVTSSAEGALAMVSVTNCKIENVSLDGFNSQLNITDTVTKIEDIVISTKAKVILEAGKYEGMKDPTVKDNGEIARVDMTKETELVVLSIYSNPYKLEYNIGDKIDLTGLTVMGTYSTDVETFKSGGWKSEGEDTITKCEDEKDYTAECDLSKAGVSIVTITSKKNPEIKCSFHVFVKQPQNTDEEKPEEKIEITDVYLKIFGTAKTTYKVGERLDLSCYQVMGKYNGIKVNLPYTSEPANGAVLETAGENIEIKFHYDGGTLTQTIKVTKPWVVTFKDGNEILYTTEVADGGKLSQLPVAPSKNGYTFGGWYNGDNEFKAGDNVTSDLELTAQWNANTYIVQFDANGGSDEMQDQPFVYDIKQALTENKFARAGYTFAGWATSADGNVVYTNKYEVLNLTAENNVTVILYAVWKVQTTFYVKSKADGTTGENVDGTENNPFATIQDAVNKIIEVNDEQAEFTINVQSDINPGATISYENNNSALINIVPEKKLNLKICGTQNIDGTYSIISASGQQQGRVMYIGGNATVTLENITLTAGVTAIYNNGGGVYVAENGTLNMNSGATIRNCKALEGYGGGVYVAKSGTLNMYSGAIIASCEASDGGGVNVTMGTFNMSGNANIENCCATSSTYTTHGGGVYVGGGTFTMSDNASIKNCEVDNDNGDGGGVYITYSGKFTMSGGEISGCKARDGGGVYITYTLNSETGAIYNGEFNMTGGSISGCEASLSGGGVWMDGGSSFTMSGNSKIEECTAISEGGGVYATDENNPCSFTMNDSATITGCSAVNGGGVSYGCGTKGTFEISGNAEISNNVDNGNGGGGIYLYGKLTMTGGTISGNEASNGAGVYVSGNSVFEMSVGTISENTATSHGGGVYVSSSGSFKMTSGTISENNASNGKGVYVSISGTFEFSGSAVVNLGNDVYLSGNNATVTIAGDLTATADNVATITPSLYEDGTQVLTVKTDSDDKPLLNLTDEIISKFSLTQLDDGRQFVITQDGKLQKQ